jgi:putative intracellular protease/amidase
MLAEHHGTKTSFLQHFSALTNLVPYHSCPLPSNNNHNVTIMASSQKVLIILSDADYFDMKKTSGADAGKVVSQPSGFFLMELAKPLSKILEAGYEVTFATPEGKEPVPDPLSESLLAFAGNFYERRRENELLERMKKENGFSSPRKFRDISEEELEQFRGVFIPGGHAPLTDLGDNKDLGRILEHFHGKQKPTATICHGPWAFLSTKASSGKFIYAGYKLTCWSDMEESLMETMLGAEIPKVESALRAEGAEMVEGVAQKVGYITVDREVVSGANPMAANAMADKFIEMMKA